MKCRLDSKSISTYFRIQKEKRKKDEKGRKDKEKETKEYEIQIEVKHINGIQN